MKIWKRLSVLLLSVVTAFGLSSCMDMGVGEEEDSYKDYVSKVLLLSPSGRVVKPIDSFTEDIHLGDTEIRDNVVGYRAYSYIGFKISSFKDVIVDEFALFMKTKDGEGEHTLDLEFYVTPKMPTKLDGLFGGDPVYFPEETDAVEEEERVATDLPTDEDGKVVDRDGEVKEEDLQGVYFTSQFTVSEEWDSKLFEFKSPQAASGGDYIVIKIKNNCAGEEYAEENSDIEFTINYLMFRFTGVSDKSA